MTDPSFESKLAMFSEVMCVGYTLHIYILYFFKETHIILKEGQYGEKPVLNCHYKLEGKMV